MVSHNLKALKLIERGAEGCAEDSSVCAERSEGASSHLPGFDFVLVVILKDAFIAQTQPPWDPLLVLKTHQNNRNASGNNVHVCGIDRETKTKYK